MEEVERLAIETINLGKQAIIFTPSRASAEKTAENISKLTSFFLISLEESALKGTSTPTKQCKRLSRCVKKGVAFHHAGLLSKQKDLVEDNFRDGKIKVICATPTLAAGLSLPAYRVIIKSLKRYSGKWGMDWIPVLEYMQMAGRAGRPEYEKLGEAITIAKNDKEKRTIYEKYVCGEPEEIYSKLAVEPVLRTHLLSLISSGIITNEEEMQKFFANTFWAHQFEDLPKLEYMMEKMLELLEDWGMIKNSDGFLREKKIRASLIGRRISELYLDPLTAKHLLDCSSKFTEEKTIFSLLFMICHTLEMRPLLRIKTKEREDMQEELFKHCEELLEEEFDPYDLEYHEFMNALKTALFFEAWINEHDEDFLLEKFNIRPGEIRVKVENADWLLYAVEELAKLNHQLNLIREVRRLRIRIKQGIKEELLPLVKLKGVGRVRARKLYANGIKDIGDLKKIDTLTLTQIIGKARALEIKKLLGQEVKEIPKGKRKGQMSLTKFS